MYLAVTVVIVEILSCRVLVDIRSRAEVLHEDRVASLVRIVRCYYCLGRRSWCTPVGRLLRRGGGWLGIVLLGVFLGNT